jgi:RNA polymerase sigma-70 factor (ECF subfamily)
MASIEAVYVARFAQLHRVASAIIGDSERGRDAVQEAFARAIGHRTEYRGDGPLDAWLWRTVTNVARDHRRLSRFAATGDDDGVSNLGETCADSDHPLGSMIRERIVQLPERQRLVLFLRYYADLSYREIAAALGIQTGTVSATLNAAHESVRSALADLATGPSTSSKTGPSTSSKTGPSTSSDVQSSGSRALAGVST